MNHIIYILFLVFSVVSFGQSTLTSSVYDIETKEPLSFVNVGIVNKNIGTVSKLDGSFSITINPKNYNDSLRLSYVGYESTIIPIKDFNSRNTDTILLVPRILELEEVEVKPTGKWKSKRHGLTRHLPGVYGEIQSDTISDIVECAQLVNLDTIASKITSFNIYLKSVNTDTAQFRINFYNFEDSIPSENRAFNKPIIIKEKISKGWLKIDLQEYNIWLSGNIIASIEFLPTDEQTERVSLSYGGILICKETSYNRTSSQGEWYKLDFGTYSIHLETKKYVRR